MISIKNLTKSFGKIQALDDLGFQVEKGDIFGFLGPNGSGKSTTIRILTSLVKADSGSVYIFGLPLKTARKQILSRLGALIERPAFYEHLSALKNLALLSSYSGTEPDRQTILETLALVGLAGRETDKVRNYSEGMKQRLGIAQAIIHKPELLILDEPFNNLDPQGVKDVRDIILRLNEEQGLTIVISSHKLDEIEKLATNVVLINQGKTVAESKIDDLLNRGVMQVKLLTDDPKKAFQLLTESALKLEGIKQQQDVVLFSCGREVIPKVNTLLVEYNIKVFSLNQDQSLESFFLSFTK